MLNDQTVLGSARKALDRRAELIARGDLDSYRLVHGEADGLAGVFVERYGPALTVQLKQDWLQLSESQVRLVVETCQDCVGARTVYRKFFVRDRARLGPSIEAEHHQAEPWIGEAVGPELAVVENGMRFLVHPYDGFSTGLFLEHRENRRRVREISAGRRVLNTFSYTCAFSVAAAMGGAASVDSVDVSKKYLEWGKRNLAANGMDVSQHKFFCSDVMEFYQRAERQKRRYDLVILDPPTFSRLREPQRTFVLDEELEALVSGAMGLLDPEGKLLLCTNQRTLSRARSEAAIRSAVGKKRVRIEAVPLPADFGGDPDYSKSFLASL